MLKIYQFRSCPFCQKVVFKIFDLGLKQGEDYELVEASFGTPGRDEVIALGGKSQVPFMVDGETKLYESNDIIQYLENKFQK
ncbi:MAG: glutathione S-transferase N-terminal domain-containing protein [Leptospira sp.]|nr:glutathione S-transferase N-terminal domain-containing protein [Leptospira sp.]